MFFSSNSVFPNQIHQHLMDYSRNSLIILWKTLLVQKCFLSVCVGLSAGLGQAYTYTQRKLYGVIYYLYNSTSRREFQDLSPMKDSEVKFPPKCLFNTVISSPLKPAQLLPKVTHIHHLPFFEPNIPNALGVRRRQDLCNPRELASRHLGLCLPPPGQCKTCSLECHHVEAAAGSVGSVQMQILVLTEKKALGLL